jgi:quercetin dioxygenase-like cupin family protein
MSNIVSLSDAEASAEYFPDMQVWWNSELATGTHQELNWARFEPGSTYPLHSHPYEQTSVVIQGRMRLTVDEPVIFIDVYSPPSGGHDGDVTYY